MGLWVARPPSEMGLDAPEFPGDGPIREKLADPLTDGEHTGAIAASEAEGKGLAQ